MIIVGVFVLFGAISLLVVAAIISSAVASSNATCARIPNCIPQSDPSGALAIGGVVVLLVAIFLLAYGFREYSRASRE